MQQQPSRTPGGEPATASPELFHPRGGTDPDFHFPADRGQAPGRVSRWMTRLIAARADRRQKSTPQSEV